MTFFNIFENIFSSEVVNPKLLDGLQVIEHKFYFDILSLQLLIDLESYKTY